MSQSSRGCLIWEGNDKKTRTKDFCLQEMKGLVERRPRSSSHSFTLLWPKNGTGSPLARTVRVRWERKVVLVRATWKLTLLPGLPREELDQKKELKRNLWMREACETPTTVCFASVKRFRGSPRSHVPTWRSYFSSVFNVIFCLLTNVVSMNLEQRYVDGCRTYIPIALWNVNRIFRRLTLSMYYFLHPKLSVFIF